jgi:hypothetical protein
MDKIDKMIKKEKILESFARFDQFKLPVCSMGMYWLAQTKALCIFHETHDCREVLGRNLPFLGKSRITPLSELFVTNLFSTMVLILSLHLHC